MTYVGQQPMVVVTEPEVVPALLYTVEYASGHRNVYPPRRVVIDACVVVPS
jgi:hypothetical protein